MTDSPELLMVRRFSAIANSFFDLMEVEKTTSFTLSKLFSYLKENTSNSHEQVGEMVTSAFGVIVTFFNDYFAAEYLVERNDFLIKLRPKRCPDPNLAAIIFTNKLEQMFKSTKGTGADVPGISADADEGHHPRVFAPSELLRGYSSDESEEWEEEEEFEDFQEFWE